MAGGSVGRRWLLKLRGGYYVRGPLDTEKLEEADPYGLFYHKPMPQFAEGRTGTPMEVLSRLADETHWFHANNPQKHPDADPREVVVTGLPISMNERGAYEYFLRYGEIKDLRMPVNENTGLSKGIAFITFEEELSAELVVFDCDGQTPFEQDTAIRCHYAKPGELEETVKESFQDDGDLYEKINQAAMNPIARNTYEDFMMESRSASPDDDPRDFLYKKRKHIFAPHDLAAAKTREDYESRQLRDDEPRLFQMEGEPEVGNQELSEALIGAPRGALNTLFEGEEEQQQMQKEAMEGLATAGYDLEADPKEADIYGVRDRAPTEAELEAQREDLEDLSFDPKELRKHAAGDILTDYKFADKPGKPPAG